ncbi:MAG TPA: hypothetical protein VL137_06855 [Polyangiaceae bacterium]|nr:hypothetical protein [Polyangiaceae bacterium]
MVGAGCRALGVAGLIGAALGCSQAKLDRSASGGNSPTATVATEYPNLHGVARGASQFVAVGGGGVVVTSADGKSWHPEDSSVSSNLTAITYGGGTFVAVGDAGTLLISPDGVAWSKQVSTTTSDLQSVVFGNGTFVAVGWDLQILTSTDGVSWTQVYSGAGVWQDVTFTGDEFVAVNRVGGVIVSQDAITWNLSIQGNTATDEGLWGVGPGPSGGVIAVTFSGNAKLSTDSAVTQFTVEANLSADFTPTVASNCDITALSDSYVITLDGGLEASPDGVRWTPLSLGKPITALASNGTQLVGVGDVGSILNATCSGGVCSDPQLSRITVPAPTNPGGGNTGGSSCAGQCDSSGACGACASTADCCTGAVCISAEYCLKGALTGSCDCNPPSTSGVCADFPGNGHPEVTACGGVGTASCNTQYSWCCPGLVAVQNGAQCSCEDPGAPGYACAGQ